MKKILVISAFLSVSVGLIFGQDYPNNYWYSDDCYTSSACQPAVPACACVPECGTITVGGDWLWWKTEQDKMEFGANVMVSGDDDTLLIDSDIIRPQFNERNGYRVYADYVTPSGDWKLTAAFTHVPGKASVFVDENPSSVTLDFISLFNANFPIIEAISEGVYTTVEGLWHSEFEYVDLDASRIISITDRFQIKPHVGIRGIWSDQKFRISGVGDDVSFVSNLKQTIKGIGIEGGLCGQLYLNRCFSIVGHFGGGLIYTRFNNKGNLSIVDGLIADIHYSDITYRSIAMVDAYIGLNYEGRFGCTNFSAHVGWEQHVVFDTNQFSISCGANMTLQGLTLGGNLFF